MHFGQVRINYGVLYSFLLSKHVNRAGQKQDLLYLLLLEVNLVVSSLDLEKYVEMVKIKFKAALDFKVSLFDLVL